MLNSKGSRETIIQILSHEWPLSTKQLHHKVKREMGIDITYQAVHKSIQEMEKGN